MSAATPWFVADIGVQVMWQRLALLPLISQRSQSLALIVGPCSTMSMPAANVVGAARGWMPARKASNTISFQKRVRQNPRIAIVCGDRRRTCKLREGVYR